MSKAIGSVLGTNVKVDTSAGENYLSYLKSYDTSTADKTNNLMAQEAYQLASDLSNQGLVSAVSASDEARQRMENATYQSYMDRLIPQHQQQMADLETRLANQGLSVGSQAYQTAVNNLMQEQNDSINQATYKSVIAGQDAYTQSLNDAIAAGNFTNTAYQTAINQMNALLQNSPTGYQNQANIYAVQEDVAQQQASAKQQSLNNMFGVLGGALNAATTAYGYSQMGKTASNG